MRRLACLVLVMSTWPFYAASEPKVPVFVFTAPVETVKYRLVDPTALVNLAARQDSVKDLVKELKKSKWLRYEPDREKATIVIEVTDRGVTEDHKELTPQPQLLGQPKLVEKSVMGPYLNTTYSSGEFSKALSKTGEPLCGFGCLAMRVRIEVEVFARVNRLALP